jgi:signal recognition particle subunit SRP54
VPIVVFESLTERLGRALDGLRGRGRLSEENIQESLREVRRALLEADVALPVVRDFVERVRVRAVGQEVLRSLTPGQEVVRIVRDELTALMGERGEELVLDVPPPAVVMLAGLQGTGKTTTVAKLARRLREHHRRRVLVASCDVYRPAAIRQLETLAGEVEVAFFPSEAGQDPVEIARGAVVEARRRGFDTVIIDTAGRLHVDAAMMDEARRIHAAVKPAETLFVVDAMSGQDAVRVAKAFDEALPLTGIILSKADGDARGGAALSIRHVTGKPIKFLGVGEKSDALEPFHPDRMASRILGMGDVLSLIEEAERKVDRDQAEKLARKLKKGEGFDLEDFAEQLRQMRGMGGIAGLMDKLPGTAGMTEAMRGKVDDRQLVHMEAIVGSMTMKERRFPAIIKGSRKRRIAAGSGTHVQDVNRLLKQFGQMQKMMKQVRKKGGLQRLMRGMGGLGGGGGPGPGGGGLPPGFPR